MPLPLVWARIVAVFALLNAPFVAQEPIWLPLLATYAGIVVELGVFVWGYRRYVSPLLPATGQEGITFGSAIAFFWPLALIMAVQGLSRPLINLFVARGPQGDQALAILAVVYILAHIPYGWLNELRSLPQAFQNEDRDLRHIRRFIAGCGLVSFALMATLFWTPLRHVILVDLIGVEPALAAACRIPLWIFSFFSLVVATRAYGHGVALLERRTAALVPSGPLRIGAILTGLYALPLFGVYGATLGIAALFFGFIVETGAVWWGVLGTWKLESKTERARRLK